MVWCEIWDLNTAQELHTINDMNSEALDVTYGSNLLFGSTYDSKIAVYNANDYSRVTTLSGHAWEVWQLQYTQNVLFSGSHDHTIKRWDLRNYESTATLRGHNVCWSIGLLSCGH